MKFYLLSPDANGNIDGTVTLSLINHLPGRVHIQEHADFVLVVVAYLPNYKFNEQLFSVTKPVVLMDFCEYGWDAGDKPNVLGTGVIRNFGHLNTPQWAALDQWVSSRPPVLHFKRELLKRDAGGRMKPIEFPCQIPAIALQGADEFNTRPLEVFSSWGLSHPSRPRLHGDIFRNAHDNGIHVIDAWDQDGHFEGKRNWATIHCPHYIRKPMSEVMQWNQRAKVSVSLPGAGVKCFRSTEAPAGSIMALHEDKLEWSIPWVDGENALRLPAGEEFATLNRLTLSSNLHDIYVASQETLDRYRSARYVSEYIVPAIKEAL